MQWPLLPAYNPDPGKPSEMLTFFLVHQLLAGRVYHLPEEPITEANSHFRVSPTLAQLFRHSPSQIKFRAQSRAKGTVVTRADLSLKPEKEV